MKAFQQAWQVGRDRFGALTVNQRLTLGMVAAAVLISATVFGLWLGREDSAVLFSDLTVEDAHRSLQELDKRGVKSSLAHGGTTILVPASQVHRLRLDLAATGVARNSVLGYEVFDRNSFGMTEQEFDVKWRQALEGELTRTIKSLQGVDDVRVHLVIPKPSIFRSQDREPTASVAVSINRRHGLSPEQVFGIQSLVAGSVEGLVTDRVTVVDQNSRTLSGATAAGAFPGSDQQLELKKNVEEYLTEKAQSLLTSVLGPGRAHVRVNARLDHEQIESERVVYDPNTTVRSEERNESTDPQTGGTTESSLTNYEINQTVERIVAMPGGIRQLSVSVSVDGDYQAATPGEAPVYQPLPQEQVEGIRRMVQSALGIDMARGDQLEVINLQFQVPQSGEPQRDGLLPGGWLQFVLQNGGRILLAIMLVSLVLVFRNNLAATLGELTSRPERADAGAPTSADGEPVERFDGLPPLTDQMMEDVRDYAAEHPERVAEVVQSWLQEPERSGR